MRWIRLQCAEPGEGLRGETRAPPLAPLPRAHVESASWSRGPRRAGPEHVSVKDKQQLRLLVGNAGDGGTCDHADWADARLE
ncbi:hypothetical protein F0U61_09610 [Archangium violaceum]|nr:hypothetical protein F0U61_09610 [Archangium violaceum]